MVLDSMKYSLKMKKGHLTAIKASIATSVAQVSKIAFGFAVVKLIAIYLGPDGLGSLGNYMTLASAVTLFAGGGIVSGLIKYVSSYRGSLFKLTKFISTAFVYSVVFTVIMVVGGLLMYPQIGAVIFKEGDGSCLLLILIACIPLFSITNFITGIVNGYQNTALYMKISAVGFLLAIPISYYLIRDFGFLGAGIALVSGHAITAIFSLIFTFDRRWRKAIKFRVYAGHAENLSKFTLMLAVGASVLPTSEIFVRNMIVERIGLFDAGIWQSLIKLSTVYISFFSLFLGYYYMPRLSALSVKSDIRSTVSNYLGIGAVSFVLFGIIFYSLRYFIIEVALSKDFLPGADYLIYQLIADFFKVCGYVIGYLGVAKAATKLYIGAEILQAFLFSFMSYIFLEKGYGLKGIFGASILTSVVYFLAACSALVIYFYRGKFGRESLGSEEHV